MPSRQQWQHMRAEENALLHWLESYHAKLMLATSGTSAAAANVVANSYIQLLDVQYQVGACDRKVAHITSTTWAGHHAALHWH